MTIDRQDPPPAGGEQVGAELWDSLQRGLAQSRAGDVVDGDTIVPGGDFTVFIDD